MIYKLAPHVHFQGHDANIKNPDMKEVTDFFLEYNIITLVVHSTGITKESYSSFVEECKKYSTPKKLIIPCLEDESKKYHILLIGAESYNQDICNTKNHLTILAHPWGYAYQTRKIKKEELNIEEFDGIEVWNLFHNSKKYPSLKTLKFFQQLPITVKSYIGLDEHPPFRKHDAVMLLECENLTKENVIKALKEGKFYSRVKDFTISSQGELKRCKKNIKAYTKMKCLMHESLTHMISLLAVTGNKAIKKSGIKTKTTYKVKKAVNRIRRNI